MPNQSILITGSAGFIGSHLSEYYLKNGFIVIGIDNYITGSIENTQHLQKNYSENFIFFEGDITLPWSFLPAPHLLTNLKYVYHLASPASVLNYQKYSVETMLANSVGLNNAIEFADAQKARLIFSSTSEIYGSPLHSPQKESDWGYVNSYGPRSCYDESKRYGEALIYSKNIKNNSNHGIVRIFNTYGPKMNLNDDRVPNAFINNAFTNSDLVVYGDGTQTRSFCYIDDLITGLTLYADANINLPMNLGNDSEITIYELAEAVIKLTSSNSKIIYSTKPIDEPTQRKPDLTLAKTRLGYSPQVSLLEGLQKTICKK